MRRHLRVVDLFPAGPNGLSADTLAWAQRMGTDVERAWRECPDAILLMLLAHGLGVPASELLPMMRPRTPIPAEVLRAAFESGPGSEQRARLQERRLAEHDEILERIRARFDVADLLRRGRLRPKLKLRRGPED